MAYRKPRQSWEIKQLTDIHRPERPDEATRIEAQGGQLLREGEACRLLAGEWTGRRVCDVNEIIMKIMMKSYDMIQLASK